MLFQKSIPPHCEFESEGNECCLRIQLSLCISNLNHPVRYETKGLQIVKSIKRKSGSGPALYWLLYVLEIFLVVTISLELVLAPVNSLSYIYVKFSFNNSLFFVFYYTLLHLFTIKLIRKLQNSVQMAGHLFVFHN